jgi:hypothetical protein
MSDQPANRPSPEALADLEALREAVAQELDRKRRLGHYTVMWKDGKIVLEGEDAPDNEQGG